MILDQFCEHRSVVAAPFFLQNCYQLLTMVLAKVEKLFFLTFGYNCLISSKLFFTIFTCSKIGFFDKF